MSSQAIARVYVPVEGKPGHTLAQLGVSFDGAIRGESTACCDKTMLQSLANPTCPVLSKPWGIPIIVSQGMSFSGCTTI